jgi:hypothetical protein
MILRATLATHPKHSILVRSTAAPRLVPKVQNNLEGPVSCIEVDEQDDSVVSFWDASSLLHGSVSRLARIEAPRLVAVGLALLLGAVVLAASAPARAESDAKTARADDQHQARAFFEIGAQAYEQGRYAEAIEAFRNAYQRMPRAGLLFSIAQARRRAFFASGDMEQLVDAIEHYRAYLSTRSVLHRKRDAELALEHLVPLLQSGVRVEVDNDVAAPSRLMVSTTTPGAVVQIDGGEAVTTLPYVATVTPGTHDVTLSAPGHTSQTRRVLVPVSASFALAVDLQPLPGLLSLSGPEGSEVWLDGRLVTGLPVSRLPVQAGTHRLVVRRPGRHSHDQNLRVTPGSITHVDIELRNTSQRNVSLGSFAGAGACLLGTGAFALLSWREQGIAQDWVRTRNERALLASEHAAYENAVRHRDQYRTVALGTGLASAALGIVGAVLYNLDTPPLPDAPGPAGESHDDESPGFEALPGFDSSTIRWHVRGQF